MRSELSEAFRATRITLRLESVWRGTLAMTARPLSAPALACSTVILCWRWRSIPPSRMAAGRRNLPGQAERHRPCTSPAAGIASINATNIFQGLLGCLPPNFGYLPNEQRFNALLPNSIFVNQNYLSAGLPLSILPFGFPTAKNFQFAYSQQANLSIERDLGHDFALNLAYNFNGGHHLNRPVDVNAPVYGALISNWRAAMSDSALTTAQKL